MTKGATLIMLPANTPNDQLEQLLEDTVHLFAEWFPGIPVTAPCVWCQSDAIEAANREVGTFGQIGVGYLRLPIDQRPDWVDYPAFKQWQQVACSAIGASRPDCHHCKGRGFLETKLNPSSIYFDYWDIIDDHEFFPEGEIPEVRDFEVLVTLDGVWHHRWSQEDMSIENWERLVMRQIEANPGHITGLCYMKF